MAELDSKPGQDGVSWLVAGRAGSALLDLAKMIIRSDWWLSYCADYQISDLQILLIFLFITWFASKSLDIQRTTDLACVMGMRTFGNESLSLKIKLQIIEES